MGLLDRYRVVFYWRCRVRLLHLDALLVVTVLVGLRRPSWWGGHSVDRRVVVGLVFVVVWTRLLNFKFVGSFRSLHLSIGLLSRVVLHGRPEDIQEVDLHQRLYEHAEDQHDEHVGVNPRQAQVTGPEVSPVHASTNDEPREPEYRCEQEIREQPTHGSLRERLQKYGDGVSPIYQYADEVEEALHYEPDRDGKEYHEVLNLLIETDVFVEAVVEVADHEGQHHYDEEEQDKWYSVALSRYGLPRARFGLHGVY